MSDTEFAADFAARNAGRGNRVRAREWVRHLQDAKFVMCPDNLAAGFQPAPANYEADIMPRIKSAGRSTRFHDMTFEEMLPLSGRIVARYDVPCP